MPDLKPNLLLGRCPHCSVANPNLHRQHLLETADHGGANKRVWGIYVCGRCGGVVSASAPGHNHAVLEYFPASRSINDELPERPKAYLRQALESLHAPAGAVMLAASAVDAMQKVKGLSEGSLYARIEKAAEVNLITDDMSKWAHEVRLDANDQRHADEAADLPTEEDASRVLDFASALGEILFVLPKRVQRGIERAAAG
ncbi:MAG: DUF4145 domain-containing protein [Xanthomonadales bacterium]|nr:DUF4145 domain-containing protein [Xanthomonadales bacterium]